MWVWPSGSLMTPAICGFFFKDADEKEENLNDSGHVGDESLSRPASAMASEVSEEDEEKPEESQEKPEENQEKPGPSSEIGRERTKSENYKRCRLPSSSSGIWSSLGEFMNLARDFYSHGSCSEIPS